MVFHSVLFETPEDSSRAAIGEAPAFFGDLNLDQIVDVITLGKQEYDLKPFFFTSLNTISAIEYRHEVMRDLEQKTLFDQIQSFARTMRAMRQHLEQAEKLYYKYQKKRWFLDAVKMYSEAVVRLAQDLSLADLKSRGLLGFREYVTDYTRSGPFPALHAETEQLLADLSTVRYCLIIKGNRIQVRNYDSELDYSADVEHTFERFKQGVVKDYRVEFPVSRQMNHIEAQILDLVAKLNPAIFAHLDEYCANNEQYLDETIGAFDREIQFYIAYLDYAAIFKRAGLNFCYPHMCDKGKEVTGHEVFDVALANKLIRESASVVCNDFELKDQERIFVVSGPNQGGKTTFARTFGQLHYLASLGCPVAGREAQLFLFDLLFTHFEKEETITDLRGKLQDDLVRMHEILDRATSNSIIIMNEIFSSTTIDDAVFLSKKILERVIESDLLCVCVTFIDELASFHQKVVSMVSTIAPENPALRTYRIVRRPADGLAYAMSIAEKYRVTYNCLKERIQS